MGRLKAKRFRPTASRLRPLCGMGASRGALCPPIRQFFPLTADWLRPDGANDRGVAFYVQNGKRFKKGLKKIG